MKCETQVIERRKAHHHALETLALTVGCDIQGVTLWRKLLKIERAVSYACLQYSNDSNFGLDQWEVVKDDARKQLAKLFCGQIPKGVYVNGDPRGHALKVDCDLAPIPEGMERDWGGNGILAPIID